LIIQVTENELHEHMAAFDGVCLNCGEWTCGGVEPDAEGYDCEICEHAEVVGAELAILLDAVKTEVA